MRQRFMQTVSVNRLCGRKNSWSACGKLEEIPRGSGEEQRIKDWLEYSFLLY